VKKPAPPGDRLKGLAALQAVRARVPAKREREAPERPAPRAALDASEFLEAMQGVTPLAHGGPRPAGAPPPPAPEALQRSRDDQAALDLSLTEEIGIESLLDTDESLSYRRDGIGPDILRKLRRGFWVVQGELDLHGHRVDEARHALGEFLKRSVHRGRRCIRIVHGKGLGSRDGIPILKGKVKTWLIRHQEVIAFCQARAADGGAGALIVLLRPKTGSG
jgi:DNA-nicking Smr family endonuclease